MATQGDLRIGVIVDAGDLSGSLSRAVAPQLGAVTNQIQQQMTRQVGGSAGFGAVGTTAAGAFIGGFAAMVATKGVEVLTGFAQQALSVIQGVLSGGWDRMVSIDTAKTKMEALGHSAASVTVIMDNALAAVKGTAFGLQDAATVAANALAAGVRPGQELVDYLKLAADTAAVTRKAGADMGAEFEAVGSIINRISTQGYATNMELQMLSDRGLPIYQKLAEKMGVTSGELFKLASDSGVAASKVREALGGIVGGAALKMGESFEGGVANARAALDRLGEALLKPIFTPTKDGVSAVTAAVDGLTRYVKEHGHEIVNFFSGAAKAAVVMAQMIAMQVPATANIIATLIGVVSSGIDQVAGVIDAVTAPLRYIPDALLPDWARAFKKYGGEVADSLHGAAERGHNMADSARDMSRAAADFARDTIPGLNTAIDSYTAKAHASIEAQKKQLEWTQRLSGALKYQGDMLAWIARIREGGDPGPMPVYTPPKTLGWFDPAGPSGGGGSGPGLQDTTKLPAGGSPGSGSAAPSPSAPAAPAVDITAIPLDALPKTEQQEQILGDIRDLLAGTGTPGAPLNTLKDLAPAVKTISDDLKKTLPESKLPPGAVGERIGPFGTPIPASHPGWEMAAAAIQALGGDPEKVIGPNPVTYALEQWGQKVDAWSEQTQQQIDAWSGSAKGGMPSLPTVGGLNWDALAQAESGGNWAQPGGGAGGIHRGGLQFNPDTWREFKPAGAPDDPAAATREQQIAAAQAAIAARGGPQSLWPENWRKLYEGVPAGGGAVLPAIPAQGGGQTSGYAGLTPGAKALEAALRAAFPELGAIGGQDNRPPGTPQGHTKGLALDITIPGGTTRGGANPAGKLLGDRITAWLKANAESLGLNPWIGWQTDEGGDHYNHVHASVNEGAAGRPGMGLIPPGALGPAGTAGMTTGGVTPVFVTNWPTAGDQTATGGAAPGMSILGAGMDAAGQAANTVAGRALDAALGVGTRDLPARTASMNRLVTERNPAALAAAIGLKVGDYSRGATGDDMDRNTGPGYTADGRLFSDTAAITDRTTTSSEAAAEGRHQQLLDILGQVRDNGTEQVLKPIMQTAITEGVGLLKTQVTSAIGSSMGQAAAPPIAQAVASAVRSAVPAQPADTGAAGLGGLIPPVQMASGGPVFGGTLGVDSVPIMGQHGEYMLNVDTVNRLGGFAGVDRFVAAMRAGKVRGFATGGGVKADSVQLGAEWFGLSEVPIIGALVGALIAVLLAVIGVEIEQRDTLNEITDEARGFRGDFASFDAAGRMASDTSAMSERTRSSEQETADERIRILKLVISELIKFVIQEIVIPITQAVGNAAIQAGASAASAAINSQAPGAGNLVGSFISSAGQAGLDVGMKIWDQAAEVLTPLITDVTGEALTGLFPDLFRGLFSGRWMADLFRPLGGGLGGGMAALFAGLVGGAATDGGWFDGGGLAVGKGVLPKGVVAPERVLSPRETRAFEEMVRANFGQGTLKREVHATINMYGTSASPHAVRDRLLELVD